MAGRKNDDWERAVSSVVCERVQWKLQESGINHVTLAERMGVGSYYVKAMLSGKTMKGDQLGIQASLKLARCVGLEVGILLDDFNVTEQLVRVTEVPDG